MAGKATPVKNKNAAPPTPAKNTERAVTKSEASKNAVPAHLAGMMDADADQGTSKALDDNIIPLIYILQALSPQVTRGTPEHIKGAEAGDIWFRGTKTVVKGADGIVVQPCHFEKCVIEWGQNRGGYAGRHKTMPEGAVQIDDPKDERGKRKIWRASAAKDANDLNESREHVVIVREGLDRPAPFVIPMSGSQHTSSRGWMMLMNGKTTEGGKTPPSYACLYRMRTKHNSDGTYNWFGWDIEDASEDGSPAWVQSVDDYNAGKKIFSDFNSGKLRADEASDLGQHGASSEGEDDNDDAM